MKLTPSARAKLSDEKALLLGLALTDVVNGAVAWFGNSRQFSIGISRATSASGGICIVRENGSADAFYFESYAREALAHIASVITGHDSEHNRALMQRRAAIENAAAFVADQLRNS